VQHSLAGYSEFLRYAISCGGICKIFLCDVYQGSCSNPQRAAHDGANLVKQKCKLSKRQCDLLYCSAEKRRGVQCLFLGDTFKVFAINLFNIDVCRSMCVFSSSDIGSVSSTSSSKSSKFQLEHGHSFRNFNRAGGWYQNPAAAMTAIVTPIRRRPPSDTRGINSVCHCCRHQLS
jgi:hypothetical protein